MERTKQFDVAIIGGGIAGLTLAIALYHHGIPITVYEQAPQFGEIGAGVAFGPNAVQAMRLCHQGIFEAFKKICTRNLWSEKRNVWFDYLDGFSYQKPGQQRQEIAFTIQNSLGQSGVHRARYLDELVKLVPQDVARFDKKLINVQDNFSNGRLVMQFEDGSSAEADAIIGCDGIKSRVRQIVVGNHHPSAQPSYTYKYAYRGLVPMGEAIEAIGEELAANACLHMGPNGHILTFPVDDGRTLNIVAFRTTSDNWPDVQHLTKPAQREDALKDYQGYGSHVMKLLSLLKPDLDMWAIFDLGDHPVPTFHKGRICISGDAAHATSPHHGAGAGMCIEDSAILASLLINERVQSRHDLEAVFETFSSQRMERTQWLVQSSRWIGDCYEWRAKGIGEDFEKIEKEINERNSAIIDANVEEMCEKARKELIVRLDGRQASL